MALCGLAAASSSHATTRGHSAGQTSRMCTSSPGSIARSIGQSHASEMDTREATVVAREEALAGLSDDRAHRESKLQGKLSDVVAASAKLEREWEELKEAQDALSEQRCALLDLEKSLEDRETSLDLLESSSAKRDDDLRRRENEIDDDASALTAARHQLSESEREFQTRQEAWTSHQEQIDAEMKDAKEHVDRLLVCLLYTSDAADE